MGTKRVEGKIKKKSFKSKVTSKDNLKKKLTRMGKKSKKGLQGPSTDFMTRSSVLKKLQITLKDFRRLCILKGIYPRVPDKPPKGSDKVYYDIKDISYLSHEPLLHKFREFKSFMKKVRREAGRYQFEEARRKNEEKPIMQLNHLVKERYPRFIDALRDLDDCLSMIHLFAAMPSTGRLTAEKTKSCNELARHWQYYIARTRSLQKVFVSVKGVYFQATILGEAITWLTPHPFAQAIPRDVDMRVMTTFLEFYEVFLRFTLYKLYHMQGLQYPPKIDKTLHDAGCCLLSIRTTSLDGSMNADAIAHDDKDHMKAKAPSNNNKKNQAKNPIDEAKLKSLNAKLESIVKDVEEDEHDDEDDEGPSITGPLSESMQGLFPVNDDDDADQQEEKMVFASMSSGSNEQEAKLFSKFKFFINREVPLDWMQLCIISHGGLVGWEGTASPYSIDDASITHHIVDRPIQGQQNLSREYIQPQWIFDCINAHMLLPVQRYGPGATLPPHLSPFVDDEKEGYIPKYREELLKMKSTVEVIKDGVEDEKKQKSKIAMKEVLVDHDTDEDDQDEDEATYQKNVKRESMGAKSQPKSIIEEEEIDDDEDDEEDEVVSAPVKSNKKGLKGVELKPSQKNHQSEEEEAKKLSEIMMSKKTKRLYHRMQYGIEKKSEATKRLDEKRQNLEAEVVAPVKASASSKVVKEKKEAVKTSRKQPRADEKDSQPKKATKKAKNN